MVGQGKLVKRDVTPQETITTWDTRAPAEGLTLAGGQFTVSTRPCDTIETATYLYPEDASLADTYLTSACQYLQAYSRLLGPYPFPRFSVVENFFASGLGMPSYTLLGAGSIRRRYIQPYALGHEIVHSWLGNYVYNDQGGNWVEGLTTYLANYYWHELQGDTKQAREERRMMLWAYAVYVPPDQDYPIAQFKHKADQRDSAIGYSKAAMVFHMLRREIGDMAFFGGLKRLVAEYGGRRAGWRDLETVFSGVAGRSLRPFFARWLEQIGTVDVAASTDPDFHVFRRIPRNDLPPMLNLFVTDPHRLVVLPEGDTKNIAPYQEVARRLSKQPNVVIASNGKPDAGALGTNSVLLLGGPSRNPVFKWVQRALPKSVQLGDNAFQLDGKDYRGDGMAVLLSFRNPDDPSHVVTVFYGLSDAAAGPVAPLLFYYGWNTYVVFEDGKVIARGDLEQRPR
jgi:aminopeptidase N